jgi:hypothetical protein
VWIVELVKEAEAGSSIYPIRGKNELLLPRVPHRHRLIALANNAMKDGL